NSALTVWSGTGEGEARLPPGSYEVIATRGSEREQARQALELGAAGADLTFELASPVDSAGWLAGDFHIHAQYSPDADISPEFRVRTGLSEGLELLVMTEHDTLRDFTPDVEAIPGASAHLRAIVASEITTYLYGHFQAWPLTVKPDQLNQGGIDWFDTPAPELFARIRASEAAPVIIQPNHPRGVSAGSYFTALGLSRESGTIENWELWSDDFDSIEVFNGGCSNGDSEAKLDFYDMLNRGYRVSVSAGTDSHSQSSTLGAPRVYVPSPHAPAELDPQELVTAFQEQRVYVSCGPVVGFQVEGRGLGEQAPAAGGQVTAHLRVQAPTWMTLAEARIVRNGQVAWTLPAADWTGGAGGVRLELDVPVAVDGDAWLALEVTGQGSLWPIDGDAPYALTNPIYVDADGDGRWTPPGLPYRPRTP
ncbi:MAG TPA: CehA/McbA family metallohydrolase, partial [Myxococcota bacterium]|nr:CehA/McbA family metallohydrolase [Myxococcota bacterium]